MMGRVTLLISKPLRQQVTYSLFMAMVITVSAFQAIATAATAEAAAVGTGTSMSYEIIHGNYSVLPNDTLAKVMHSSLASVGGVEYSKADEVFAAEISKTLPTGAYTKGRAAEIKPFETGQRGNGSTDVGDVSWTVPTVGMSTATWVPGTGAHTWQASVGCDAQPWFRIFNPILQSQKFDSDGKFIKKYIPELSAFDKKNIHEPHSKFAPKNYPKPIIDHAIQRQKALKMFEHINHVAKKQH